jgi:hypothetical protein
MILPMDDTHHDVIDGRRTRTELSAAEREKVAALAATIEATARPLRGVAVPDFSARVMAEVLDVQVEPSPAESFAAAARKAFAWLWVPRPLTVRLRPGYAMATMGALALWAVAPFSAPAPAPAPSGLEPVAVADAAPPVYVQFRLETQGAASVVLAGSFTGWRPAHEMRETAPGIWSILLPLEPGVHDYAFVVDGDRWVADPHALQIDDGFGGSNSRIALPSPPAPAKRS